MNQWCILNQSDIIIKTLWNDFRKLWHKHTLFNVGLVVKNFLAISLISNGTVRRANDFKILFPECWKWLLKFICCMSLRYSIGKKPPYIWHWFTICMSYIQNIFMKDLDPGCSMDAISVLLSCKASNPYVSIGTTVVAIKCNVTASYARFSFAFLLGMHTFHVCVLLQMWSEFLFYG